MGGIILLLLQELLFSALPPRFRREFRAGSRECAQKLKPRSGRDLLAMLPSVWEGRNCPAVLHLRRRSRSPSALPSPVAISDPEDSGETHSSASWNVPPTASRLPWRRCRKSAGRLRPSTECDRGPASPGRT